MQTQQATDLPSNLTALQMTSTKNTSTVPEANGTPTKLPSQRQTQTLEIQQTIKLQLGIQHDGDGRFHTQVTHAETFVTSTKLSQLTATKEQDNREHPPPITPETQEKATNLKSMADTYFPKLMNSLPAKQLDHDGRLINVFYDTVPEQRARELAPLYTTNFYLSNVYDDNNEVKENGGRFDKTLRTWYLPPLTEIRPCLKFIHKEAFHLMKEYVFRPDPSRFKSAGNASSTPQSLPDLNERTPPDSLSSAEEEQLSSHYIKQNFHKCPHCDTPMDASEIEYIKLRCVNKSCGHSFCRICSLPWVPGHHNLQSCPNAAMRPKANETQSPPTSEEEDGKDGLGNVRKRLVFGKGKSEEKDTKIIAARRSSENSSLESVLDSYEEDSFCQKSEASDSADSYKPPSQRTGTDNSDSDSDKLDLDEDDLDLSIESNGDLDLKARHPSNSKPSKPASTNENKQLSLALHKKTGSNDEEHSRFSDDYHTSEYDSSSSSSSSSDVKFIGTIKPPESNKKQPLQDVEVEFIRVKKPSKPLPKEMKTPDRVASTVKLEFKPRPMKGKAQGPQPYKHWDEKHLCHEECKDSCKKRVRTSNAYEDDQEDSCRMTFPDKKKRKKKKKKKSDDKRK